MDDGSKSKKGLHLNTYGLTLAPSGTRRGKSRVLDDVELLMKTLINKFGLKCSIYMKNNQPPPYVSVYQGEFILVSPRIGGSTVSPP